MDFMREKMAPHEEAMRVPLIFRWPGQAPAGRRSDALFTPLDHLPALAGIAVRGGLDGIDLSAAVRTCTSSTTWPAQTPRR